MTFAEPRLACERGARIRSSGGRTWPTSRRAAPPSRTTSSRTACSRRPEDFKERSLVASPFLYDDADEDYQGFWAKQAGELVDWFEEWHTICEWELPFAKWFVGGKLNVSYNCLDRHVAAGQGDKVAYHWEGEPGDTRTITYAELLAEVQRFANVLKSLGVQKGDRVAIYMPMIPELPGGHARLHAYRRAAFRRVRRVQPGLVVRPHQRRRVQGARHRRRRLPAGARPRS